MKVIDLFLFVFFMFLMILFFPIIFLLVIFGHSPILNSNKKYKEYLNSINGTKFFYYNNRKNSQFFIEQNIIPKLNNDVNILFVEGKELHTDLDKRFISTALYSIKNKKGMPYFIKISNGKVIATSIHQEVYNAINQSKNIDTLIEEMNLFYSEN